VKPCPFWNQRAVLITGATGLLGSRLVVALAGRGAHVHVLMRPQGSRTGAWDGVSPVLVKGDVQEGARLRGVLAAHAIETVFHLAAQSIVGLAQAEPVPTLEANIRGTWNVLEACRLTPSVGRLLVASTDKAYGEQPGIPFHEETPLQALHPYAASKACADILARTYAHTYALPVCVTRCANLYGPGDLNFSRIIPSTIRAVLRNERPVLRSDGRMKRDYLYVQDAVLACLELAERAQEDRCRGQAFNFTSEEPLTTLDVVRRVLAAAGRPDLEPLVGGAVEGEIQDTVLSAERARRILAWQPRFSMAEALNETVAWYRNRLASDEERSRTLPTGSD